MFYRYSIDARDPRANAAFNWFLWEEGRLPELEERLREHAEFEDGSVMYGLGMAHAASGELDDAAYWFRRSLDEWTSQAMVELGEVLERQGDLAGAEHWYREAIEDGDDLGIILLGSLLERKGKRAEAEALFAEEVETDAVSAVFMGGLHARRGDLKGAEEWYRRATQTGDRRPRAAVSDVMTTGRTRSSAPRITASRTGMPAPRIWLKYEIKSTPSCTATPKIEMNPTAAEMLNGVPRQPQCPDAAHRRGDHVDHDQQRVLDRVERGVEQHHDQPIESGTIHISRALAFCIWANSPDHSMSVALGELGLRSWDRRRPSAWASSIAEARSRSWTLNLIGMNRRLFSR